jgi:DNA-binding NarL/FixJ family response regulator
MALATSSRGPVQNILGTLQMHNRVELVRYAISKGLHRD